MVKIAGDSFSDLALVSSLDSGNTDWQKFNNTEISLVSLLGSGDTN